MDSQERANRLDLARERATEKPESVSVRELMSWFGARGRGYKVVDRMRAELDSARLKTEPDFASAHIDSKVKLVPLGSDALDDERSERIQHSEVQLRVSSLATAGSGVLSVSPDDKVVVACTVMSLNDYSQLAVESGSRSLKGFVSWETIGQARLTTQPEFVRDCMRKDPVVVGLEDPLLPILPTVAESNFVFVRAQDQTLSGIITAADITHEFRDLAGPYLIMGEIERRLRRFVDQVCDLETITAAVDPSDSREVESAEELTIGELSRLFENPDIWASLGWNLDRTEFVKRLATVRAIRNDLMHFAEEPPTPDEIAILDSFARTLAALHRD